MFEYDPEKTSIGKLRRAYALNDHEIQIVMAALWPHALSPLELWHKTHEIFWGGFANMIATQYHIPRSIFPEHNPDTEKYFFSHIYADDMLTLFSRLATMVHVNAVREGIKYILAMTYEDSSDIKVQDDIDALIGKLSAIEELTGYHFTKTLTKEEFVEVMEQKIFSIPVSYYNFISKMFIDTIFVNTVAAIRHLYFLRIPFKTEVKGITRALVDSVLSSSPQEMATTFEIPTLQAEPTIEEQSQDGRRIFRVPASLWERKSDPSVRDAMLAAGYPLEVIAYVLLNWCGINEVQAIHKTPQGRKTHVGRLISGKEYKDPKSFRNFLDPFLEKADSYIILKV